MALFKSTYFSQITNALAGTVFFRGRYGSIIGRAKSKPVDVNSNALEIVRTYFNAAAKDWQSMTDEQRVAWDEYADNTPWTNAQGDDIKLTGQAMYIGQVTSWRRANPVAPYTSYLTAPCVGGLFPTPLVVASCCADPAVGVIISCTNQDSTNLAHFVVRISAAQSPSKSYFTGPYRTGSTILIANVAAGATDTAEFCDLCPGRYFFEVRAYDGSLVNRFSSLTRLHADACTDPP